MDDLSPQQIRAMATEEELKLIADTPGQRVANTRDLAQVGLYLLKENRKLALKARLANRLPFCPDHRDKVAGKPCRECEIEELQRVIRDFVNAAVLVCAKEYITVGGDDYYIIQPFLSVFVRHAALLTRIGATHHQDKTTCE